MDRDYAERGFQKKLRYVRADDHAMMMQSMKWVRRAEPCRRGWLARFSGLRQLSPEVTMPASTTVDDKSGIVFVRAWGVLLMEELVEAQKRIAEAPNFKPHFRQLLDFADVQESRLTLTGLQQMATTTPFKRNVPRAIVANSELLSAFFRMYGVFSGNDRWRWGIFQRVEDARSWLDAVASST